MYSTAITNAMQFVRVSFMWLYLYTTEISVTLDVD